MSQESVRPASAPSYFEGEIRLDFCTEHPDPNRSDIHNSYVRLTVRGVTYADAVRQLSDHIEVLMKQAGGER